MNTGWASQERRAVIFLLKLLSFSPQDRPQMMRSMRGTGLSPDQVREWVNMFRISEKGRVRDPRPTWAKRIRMFADEDRPTCSMGENLKAAKKIGVPVVKGAAVLFVVARVACRSICEVEPLMLWKSKGSSQNWARCKLPTQLLVNLLRRLSCLRL